VQEYAALSGFCTPRFIVATKALLDKKTAQLKMKNAVG
jgi:hypothetical protein